MPVHPHPGREVILFPQQGEALLIDEEGRETLLASGTVYYLGVAPTFGLKNRGEAPFQMLLMLVQVGAGE